LLSLCFLLLGFLLPAARPVALSASSAQVERMEIVVDVGDDNNAYLDCKMTFVFFADVTSLDFAYDTSASRGFSLKKVEVSEGAIGSETDTKTLLPAFGAGNASSMRYETMQSQDRLDLKLLMPVESGAVRTVHLRFLMYGSVDAYLDVSDFHLILPGQGYPVESFAATVAARSGLAPLKVYGYGTPDLEWSVDERTGAVLYRAEHLTPEAQLRFRCLYPPELTGGKASRVDEARLAELITLEGALSTTATWSRWVLMATPWIRRILFSLVPVLMLVLCLPLSGRRERRHRSGPASLPDRSVLPPAMAGLLLRHGLDGRDVAAAVYDLAARGVLCPSGDGFALLWEESRLDSLPEHDRFLVGWLVFNADADGVFAASQMVGASRTRRGEGFRQSYDTYRHLLRARFRRAALTDHNRIVRGRVLGLVFCAVYALAAAGLTWASGEWTGLMLLFPALLFAVYGFRCRRYTQLGKALRADLKAFGSYLRRTAAGRTARGEADGKPDAQTWNLCFPYAVVLGMESAYVRATARLYGPEDPVAVGLVQTYGTAAGEGADRSAMLSGVLTRVHGFTAASQAAAMHAAGRHKTSAAQGESGE